MVGREVDGLPWAVMRRSRGLCWRSWSALGAYVGRLGPLVGPIWAVLGGLGAYVGGLGTLLGPMLAVLGALWPKCGPNPSGSRQGGPKAKTKSAKDPICLRARYRFFL